MVALITNCISGVLDAWDEVWMVKQSMRNRSRVACELNLNRGLLVLEDYLSICLFSVCCGAKQVMKLKPLRLLYCLGSLDMNLQSLLSYFQSHSIVTNITCT